jgi:hypothetical protein
MYRSKNDLFFSLEGQKKRCGDISTPCNFLQKGMCRGRSSSIQDLSGTQNTQRRGYDRHVIEGDRIFSMLGISREQAYLLLIERMKECHSIKPFETRMNELRLEKEFKEYLLTRNLPREDEIDQAFVEYELKDKNFDKEPIHPAILQTLSALQNIDIHLWKLGPTQELIPYAFEEKEDDSSSQRVDLLLVGNHYEKLSFPEHGSGIIYPCSVSIIPPDPPPSLSRKQKFFHYVISLVMVFASLTVSYFVVRTAISPEEEELDDRGINRKKMQLNILYGLISGITLQLSIHFFPIPIIKRKFNQWKNLTIPYTASFIVFIGDVLFPENVGREYGKVYASWASIIYGFTIVDICLKIFSYCCNKGAVLSSNDEFIMPAQLQCIAKKYRFNRNNFKTLGWVGLLLLTLSGMVFHHVLDLEALFGEGLGYYFNSVASGLAYGGIGYGIGGVVEGVTHTGKLDKLHSASFYFYGLFMKPGRYFYNYILLVIGGMIAGWSANYSLRKMGVQFSLRREQVKLLTTYLHPDSPLFSTLSSLKEQFWKENEQIKKERRHFKRFFISLTVTIPFFGIILSRDPLYLISYFVYGYSACISYFLSRYLKPNAYADIPPPHFGASLFLNENIMVIACWSLIGYISYSKTTTFYTSETQQSDTFRIIILFYLFTVGMLIGTYFMSFCENERHIFTIDLVRFTKVMAFLGCEMEERALVADSQDETKGSELPPPYEETVLQLTREEVLLIAMNIEKNFSSSLPDSCQKDQPVKPVRIEIIPSPKVEEKLKERAIISALVLSFITEEFSFKTAYGEYFRF